MKTRLYRAVFIALAGAVILQQAGPRTSAQSVPPDALTFFKNYFITGDYAVGGVGLHDAGVNGLATGTITLNGVKPGTDIAAAFLYWQVVVKESDGPDGGSLPVTFRGHQLRSDTGPFGKQLGTGTAPCWSSGGGTGSSGGAHKTYTYRADVLRLFDVDPATGKFTVNGSHQVQIPDGNGATALGASLVVVYHDETKPLSAIVMYDGGFTMDQSTQAMSQRIGGFYQAAAAPTAPAKLTHIVGSGQANKSENLRFNGSVIARNPFGATLGLNWDNPTFAVTPSPVLTEVTTSADRIGVNSFDCLTWAAVIYKTEVQDTDGDGLLDVWENNNAASSLRDPSGALLPFLKDMGAKPDTKDLFLEFGYTSTATTMNYGGVPKPAHTHLPSHEALRLFGDAFKNAPDPIAVHIDVGDSYPAGDAAVEAYIIRGAGLSRGGESINEQDTVCQRGTDAPAWICQFAEHPGTFGWKTGFRYVRDEVLSVTPPAGVAPPPPGEEFCDQPGYTCNRRFDRVRKDMFRYVLFAHAIGLPKSEEPCLDATGLPASADASGRCVGTTLAPLSDNPGFHTPRTNTGVGDFPGGDAMITLGAFADVNGHPVGTPFMQAATLLHEFGHLGQRRHGGDAFAPNCQPAYLSSMNYLYQLRGLLDDAGKPHIGFSRAVAAPLLDETKLTDGTLFPVLPAAPYRIGWYAPLVGSYLDRPGAPFASRHCDGTERDVTAPKRVRVDSRFADSAIDWDADGVSDFTPAFALDINYNGRTTKVDLVTPEMLGGSNDWAALRLNQIGARRNTGALYVDTNGRLAVGPLSMDTGRGDLGRGDLGRGDLGRGDLGRGDLGRGDLGRGDLGRGDLGRGDLGTLAFGRGDLGRGDLGGGDLFQNDPNNPSGELDFDAATDLARTPPNEFAACVIGVTCTTGPSTPLHDVRLEWKVPNIGAVQSYKLYRVAGATLVPGQVWTLIAEVTATGGSLDYSTIDGAELVNGAPYTYFSVAVYADGVESDPSNLVTIFGVNAPPAATGDSYTVAEDTTLTTAAPGVLQNDADEDSAVALTAVLVSGVTNGTLTFNADGSFVYVPNANYNGPDSFTYRATGGGIDSNVATVNITVTATNDGPVASNDSYATAEDTALVIAGPGVLGDDSDIDSSLTVTLRSGPAHGSVTLNPDGSFTYTPAANYSGSDAFTYRASDGALFSDATVSLTVTPVNDLPVAGADAYSMTQGSVLSVSAPGVLANDTDVDGTLAAALLAGPSNGTLTLNPNGSFTYTPASTFFGVDTFTYRAGDGAATSAATVTITVAGLSYGIIGVQNLPPPAGKLFNVGSSVPLRWQFTRNGVVFNSSNARPQITIRNSSGVVVYDGNPQDPGSSSFQPPTASNGFTWQFNWQTKGRAPGTYQVFVGSLQTGQTFAPYAVSLK